ncbi:MAG: phosphoribosylglycinamide formyltransferase [Candidatus Veblenbacteria bacterium]|nr:phosphoribosylglycinamide formyltransferase [Candidatus Veblenbacteria bacterium]
MPEQVHLAVFASTRGTDLQAILDAQAQGELPGVLLKFVLSNKPECYALERARLTGVKTVVVEAQGKTREEFDQECLRVCEEHGVNLILLIGYMRIISPVLIGAYPGRIWNIHPSLLPKYPGMDTDVHRAVLENKESESGCTLHVVDEGVDTGSIVLQEKVSVVAGETVESLKAKVQAKEQEVILKALRQFAAGNMEKGR